MKANFIFYVSDQQASTEFYSAVLAMQPTLNVPGMTEFTLRGGSVLGLMPEKGIKRLIGEALPNPEQATGIPRAELYLTVENPEAYHRRSVAHGAKELSPTTERDWGDLAGYSLDRDGHVLAFASPLP